MICDSAGLSGLIAGIINSSLRKFDAVTGDVEGIKACQEEPDCKVNSEDSRIRGG